MSLTRCIFVFWHCFLLTIMALTPSIRPGMLQAVGNIHLITVVEWLRDCDRKSSHRQICKTDFLVVSLSRLELKTIQWCKTLQVSANDLKEIISLFSGAYKTATRDKPSLWSPLELINFLWADKETLLSKDSHALLNCVSVENWFEDPYQWLNL